MNPADVIRNTNGKVFTVTFTKKDGSLRTLNGRLDVKKYLRGGENTTAHIEKYITVYDLHKKGYRNVNTETVKEIRANGQVYKF